MKHITLWMLIAFNAFGMDFEPSPCFQSDVERFDRDLKACEQSSEPKACQSIANNYQVGFCVDKSTELSITYRRKACAKNLATACYSLTYEDEISLTESESAFAKACQLNPKYCTSFAFKYLTGKYGYNYFKAKELATKTCKANDSKGCWILGTLYEQGKGVRQNYKTAKEFYGKACDLKDNDGCEKYAILNSRGY